MDGHQKGARAVSVIDTNSHTSFLAVRVRHLISASLYGIQQ